MDAFLLNISSFPTSFYTITLGIVVCYWIIAMFGIFDFDIDIVDVDADVDLDSDVSDIGRVAGLMMTLGLTGVPITIVISVVILNSWIICYLLSRFIPVLPDILFIIQMLINVGIILVSFSLSLPVSAQMIKPLKKLFKKIHQVPISRSLIGLTCRVRSSRVDEGFGEGECVNNGASLIIKIRSEKEQTFNTGDIVVIIKHQKEDDTFLVINQDEFNQQLI